VAGGANQPVLLLARTALQQGFAPIAQVNADAGGNYSFPAQSPLNSTFYKVEGAGKTSATLYEGVRDVLSAQVSATTITAGQQLVFSGTVAPSHVGHLIYLERQNASKGNFHVVEVSTLDAGSAFSISHQVYDAGSKVFRVYIPGGPENQGAASQLFTVQVNPAAASTLVPEAPGNSTQPAEGSD
jgi:hypothetical protein